MFNYILCSVATLRCNAYYHS